MMAGRARGASGGGRLGGERRPSREGWSGEGGGTSRTVLVLSKEREESIDLCDPSDVEDMNTERTNT